MRRLMRAAPWLLLLLAVADWLALRGGRVSHPLWVLGVLVALATAALTLNLALSLRTALRDTGRRGAASGEALLVLGVLVALSGGLANWLLSLQGYVILHEGEAVPLHGGSRLQEFQQGPLSRIAEMDLTLALQELELVPAGDDWFVPRSHISVGRAHGSADVLTLRPDTADAAGSLRFYQGAFGFAPRIVLLAGEETVFDRVVPFTTERHGPAGLSFAGHFTVEDQGLEVRGLVDLGTLDQGMRGHATLHLSVLRRGEIIGQGRLLPGHFAAIGEGYSTGFTDLKRWSEIDISRRNYRGLVLSGAGLALAGAALAGIGRRLRR